MGDYLGLDMKVKYESERPVDLYQIMEDGRRYLPFAISTVPLPLTGSPKTTTLSFYLDSKSSETKEIEVFFSFGKLALFYSFYSLSRNLSKWFMTRVM